MSVQTFDQLEKEELLHIFREIDKSPEVTQRGLSSRPFGKWGSVPKFSRM